MDPFIWVPGIVIVLGAAIAFRWLVILQGRVNDHAERISWLEAKVNGKERH